MSSRPKIVVSVISDLVTDQRVHKVCTSLHNNGYEILLIGAKRRTSLPLTGRNYKAVRMPMIFQKRVWFYAEYNIRLFFKLLWVRADILLGNDLDVMPANFVVSRIRRKPLVYDTHEYFLEQAELTKAFSKKVWRRIERLIFPRLQYIYTICQSFCDMYYRDYGKRLWFIRNVPFLHFTETGAFEELKKEIDARIPDNRFLLLFQGAGINVERGVEELVASTQYLDPQKFHLLIVGGGDIFEKVVQLVDEGGLRDRITIIPKVPFEVLRHITAKADLGFTLDKPNNINHIYGLPNKIFDYMHAGIPVLSSRLIELEAIISGFNIGSFINNHEPRHIAACIEAIYNKPDQLQLWKENTLKARQYYNWEAEELKLLEIYKKVCLDNRINKP